MQVRHADIPSTVGWWQEVVDGCHGWQRTSLYSSEYFLWRLYVSVQLQIYAKLIRFIVGDWFIQTIDFYNVASFRSFWFINFIASLDDIGFAFINRCIQAVETRGTDRKAINNHCVWKENVNEKQTKRYFSLFLLFATLFDINLWLL